MKPWLISVAMPQEAGLLIQRWQSCGEVGGRPAWRGHLAGREVVLQLSGMGMVNAAAAVAAGLAQLGSAAAVINLGCAGAFAESGLSQGQAVLADGLVLADMGVETARRLHGLEKTGIPLWSDTRGNDYFNRLPVDAGLTDLLDRAAGPLVRGGFVTVGRVSGDAATARRVRQRWGGIVEEMESAAVALVALRGALPFAALRGISNLVGRRELNVAAGAEAAQRALLALEGAVDA